MEISNAPVDALEAGAAAHYRRQKKAACGEKNATPHGEKRATGCNSPCSFTPNSRQPLIFRADRRRPWDFWYADCQGAMKLPATFTRRSNRISRTH
jgi:hypothetical protein